MEAGDSIVPEDDELPRGGILSTLESVRQRKAMPSHQVSRGRQAKPMSWQTKSLLVLMGLGVFSLLGSFILVVSDGHTGIQAAQGVTNKALLLVAPPAAGRAYSADGTTGSTAAMTQKQSAGLLASTAPAIELAPVPAPVPSVSPGTQAAVIESVTGNVTGAGRVDAAATSSSRNHPPATLRTTSAPTKAVVAPPPQQPLNASLDKTARRATKRQPDADVALLEAMFTHTPGRSAAAKGANSAVADQLRSACSSQTGAAAATCRARICVNNPGAQACHDGE